MAAQRAVVWPDVLWTDVERAAHVLVLRPNRCWDEVLAEMMFLSASALRYQAQTGRLHPVLGAGTLSECARFVGPDCIQTGRDMSLSGWRFRRAVVRVCQALDQRAPTLHDL